MLFFAFLSFVAMIASSPCRPVFYLRRSRLTCRSRDDVVQFVEAVSRRFSEGIGIRERARTLLDERLNVLSEKPLGLLSRLPDIEDPEHAGLVIEPGGMGDQTVERPIADLVGYEVVVLRRAIRDRELLDVYDCHRTPSVGGMDAVSLQLLACGATRQHV